MRTPGCSGLVLLCCCALATAGHAAPLAFADVIDYWSLDGSSYGETQTLEHAWDSVRIAEGRDLTYRHGIGAAVDLAGYTVDWAKLELDFTNDETDASGRYWWFGWVRYNFEEHVSYGFDGSQLTEIGEVDDGLYLLTVDVAWLNADGQLDVRLSVTNKAWGLGTAWLDHSRLYGEASALPQAHAPEPASLVLALTGLLGVAHMARRRTS